MSIKTEQDIINLIRKLDNVQFSSSYRKSYKSDILKIIKNCKYNASCGRTKQRSHYSRMWKYYKKKLDSLDKQFPYIKIKSIEFEIAKGK